MTSRSSWRRVLVAVIALSAAGCGASATGPTAPAISASASTPTQTRSGAPARPARRHRAPRAARLHRASAGLHFSSASNDVVQPQPAPGSCRALGSGPYARPDPACTPGALNPAVRQATIGSTICLDGWTERVRPSEAITEQEKAASMAAYGVSGSLGNYEYDHFVPLELGGATNDPRNLWPEPGASPNPKDAVEDRLRAEVCAGTLTLARAQEEIVRNWTALTGSPRAGSPAHRAGECSLSASYNSRYHDYDVYVHSNQPDQTVVVTDASGATNSWHTDGSGYGDVFFHAGAAAAGERVSARVGTASCSGTL